MQREARVIRREGNPVRHRVVITSDPVPATRLTGLRFLQELVVNGIAAGLMSCGPEGFDVMKVEHDGASWVLVMEAEER